MIDLKSSAAFRQSSGNARAYVRAELFVAAIIDLCAAYGDERRGPVVFKTLGDATLLRCNDIRPIIEIAVVLYKLQKQWDISMPSDSGSPFDYRFAVTDGSCAEVHTPHGVDYLGSPLDLLARISSYRSRHENSIMIVENSVRKLNENELETSFPFVKFSNDARLSQEYVKSGERALWVSDVQIDAALASRYYDYFSELRSAYVRN